MILEVAILQVKANQAANFEHDFNIASQYISSIPGYLRHNLQKCIEQPNKYILLVEWNTLEDHTIGFRQSAAYQNWKQLLHHYYDPFPTVEHFESVFQNPL
ncbi:antibiotic biosynthesis monooxygenase family protein [Mucilaginibacter paludis]|uniref:Antibiotic biosynthesis monooxygenase n=1 Tax=Mucilaginibacter paludis DSM 18603 TaxID=714943 RepID=H1Y5T3_9SPHI|nr:antibiotic biosynthesis monooxygenase [Mucilaginibacter paludis]EHQ29859.1 antibiotic biosynthesis monooxygenase [Mucilaginibacter paludis DSM 18603]